MTEEEKLDAFRALSEGALGSQIAKEIWKSPLKLLLRAFALGFLYILLVVVSFANYETGTLYLNLTLVMGVLLVTLCITGLVVLKLAAEGVSMSLDTWTVLFRSEFDLEIFRQELENDALAFLRAAEYYSAKQRAVERASQPMGDEWNGLDNAKETLEVCKARLRGKQRMLKALGYTISDRAGDWLSEESQENLRKEVAALNE